MDEEEIAKLRAETELLNLQAEKESQEIQRLEHENAEKVAIANRISQRYWFIPSATRIYQALGAGALFGAAFFFLFQPVMETVRAVAEKESKLAALEADIQEKENTKLALINDEAEARLAAERERLTAENERIKSEYQAFIDQTANDAKTASEDAKRLSEQLAELRGKDGSSQGEIQRLQLTLDQTEKTAADAASRSEQLQASLDTRLIKGLRIKVWYYRETENIARLIANPLEAAGAIVSSLKSRAFLQANENRIRGFGVNSESVAQVSAVISNIVELQTLDLGSSVSDADVVIWLNKKR